MDQYQYLLLMAGCLVLTLPLEMAGARVYRRPARLFRCLLPILAVFTVWDVVAISTGQWSFNPRYVTGWTLPLGLPVEEVAFFVAIPICALLTYESVRRMTSGLGRTSRPQRAHETSGHDTAEEG